MGGNGPLPKHPSKRSRRNSEPQASFRQVAAAPVPQPPLPDFEVEQDGEMVEFTWPARTQIWWENWADFPLAAEFGASDWDFLLDTAFLHAKFWKGASNLGAELRLRVAKLGATPEDRARLRVMFVEADEAEERRGPTPPTARERRAGLRIVPPPASSE